MFALIALMPLQHCSPVFPAADGFVVSLGCVAGVLQDAGPHLGPAPGYVRPCAWLSTVLSLLAVLQGHSAAAAVAWAGCHGYPHLGWLELQ